MSVNKVDPSTGDLSLIAGGTLYADAPVGTIQAYGGASSAIPQGWLYCNGAAVSRTTYAELFAVIGTSFGAGNGSTTFNIPDLRGEFLRGAGTNSHTGQGNGGTVGQHQNGTSSGAWFDVGGNNVLYFMESAGSGARNAPIYTDASSSDQGVNSRVIVQGTLETAAGDYDTTYTTRPTNTSVNYIIKAKQSALPIDIMSTVQTKDLASPITIGGTQQTTVEGALGALNNEVITRKDIAYTYTSATNLEGVIKEILDNQLPITTTDTGFYYGTIASTHSGSGDLGSWIGMYFVRLRKNNPYNAPGIVVCQENEFIIDCPVIADGWKISKIATESYAKSSVIVQDVFIDVPEIAGHTYYSLEKVMSIPSGYNVLAFGAIANQHWGQTLMYYTFDHATNKVQVAFYNTLDAISFYANAVKVSVLLVRA